MGEGIGNGESNKEGANMKESISVIMPVYNDKANVKKNIERAMAEFAKLDCRVQIIVVDDGSTDGTLAQLYDLKVHLLGHGRNRGKGYAFFHGLAWAAHDYVLLIDSDLQISPSELPVFMNMMRTYNADVVIGNKRHAYSKIRYNCARRFVSDVYNFMCRNLFGVNLRDTQCGFKLFKREALEKVQNKILTKRFAFDIELIVALREAGYRIADAPVYMKPQTNVGSVNLRNIWDTFSDTIAVWIRKKQGYYGK